MKALLTHIAFVLIMPCLMAQNIKDEIINYSYAQLPLQPLNREIKNFNSYIEAPYEAENKKQLAAYEQSKVDAKVAYDKAMITYTQQLKAADVQYAKDMEAWEKKSTGNKIVEKTLLGANTKPVKQSVYPPAAPYVAPPVLRSSYDYTTLANTYINLGGYARDTANAVQIIVTLYGLDYTLPRQQSVVKDMVRSANGQTQSYKATYYYTEFSYRHPMAVKVYDPAGKELLIATPQELNNYKIYKTAESENPPTINQELLIKTYEEKVLQDNLTFINKMVNDKFGYALVNRKTNLYYVKSKDGLYADLLLAFNEADAGLKTLVADAATAKPKITTAIQAWEKALTESEPTNKKARIDNDVTIAICFNLLEGYFALGDVFHAENIIKKMNTLDLSGDERKTKVGYELLFADFKKRISSQN